MRSMCITTADNYKHIVPPLILLSSERSRSASWPLHWRSSSSNLFRRCSRIWHNLWTYQGSGVAIIVSHWGIARCYNRHCDIFLPVGQCGEGKILDEGGAKGCKIEICKISWKRWRSRSYRGEVGRSWGDVAWSEGKSDMNSIDSS